MQTLAEKASSVQLLICDIDGVLTEGYLYYDAQGESLKAFHVHDGLGLKLLQKNGIEVAIITSRNSAIVDTRLRSLGVRHIFQGAENKRQAFCALLEKLRLNACQVAYAGDDLPDLWCIKHSGLGIAVANATTEIREAAHWITQKPGGQGAVREIAEMLLQAQRKWDQAVEEFLM